MTSKEKKADDKMSTSKGFFRPVKEFCSRVFHNDVAIDLGTMNTLVYVRGSGIKLDEPTVITTNPVTHEVIAVGEEAKAMLGVGTGSLAVIRPMRNGALDDSKITGEMVRAFLEKVSSPFCLMKPRVMVAVPSGIPSLVRGAVHDTFKNIGARAVRLVEEPLAAAIGAGLPVKNPEGCMIVDIGGGTTEIAIVALGNIVHCNSVNYAGDAFDDAIVRYMKEHHNMTIGELASERIKIEIGSAVPFKDLNNQSEKIMTVTGSLYNPNGRVLPGSVEVNSENIRQALMEPLEKIIDGIAKTLQACRPSIAGNLTMSGMTITGGSSQLPGLDVLLRKRFGIPVTKAENPTRSVIYGLGKMIEEFNIFDLPQAPAVGKNV